MAQKMTGALVFDERTDRYDIRFDLNSYYGGLHCGECFDVFVRGKWKPTRIEYGDNWYAHCAGPGMEPRHRQPGRKEIHPVFYGRISSSLERGTDRRLFR